MYCLEFIYIDINGISIYPDCLFTHRLNVVPIFPLLHAQELYYISSYQLNLPRK